MPCAMKKSTAHLNIIFKKDHRHNKVCFKQPLLQIIFLFEKKLTQTWTRNEIVAQSVQSMKMNSSIIIEITRYALGYTPEIWVNGSEYSQKGVVCKANFRIQFTIHPTDLKGAAVRITGSSTRAKLLRRFHFKFILQCMQFHVYCWY